MIPKLRRLEQTLRTVTGVSSVRIERLVRQLGTVHDAVERWSSPL
jgi:hypothetical protein